MEGRQVIIRILYIEIMNDEEIENDVNNEVEIN
jgi:hypothetical protein